MKAHTVPREPWVGVTLPLLGSVLRLCTLAFLFSAHIQVAGTIINGSCGNPHHAHSNFFRLSHAKG